MTTTPTASIASAATPTRRRWSPRRTTLLVAGGLLALFGVGALAGGGAALATAGHRDGDGFVTGGSGRFDTTTYAITAPSLNIEAAGPDSAYVEDLIGKIRIQVRPAQPGTSLFVGIGRADDVAGYLDRVNHDQVNHLDTGPFDASYKRHAGGEPATEPAAQTFWVASDTGTGPRTLTWPVTDGDWTVVIMNANSSAGIQADVTAGVTLPILRPIAITSLVVGGLLLTAATAVIIATVTTRRRRTPAGSGAN